MGSRMKCVVFLLMLTLVADLSSRGGEVKFERISLDQGLSQSVVRCIMQDSKGFMWFGTDAGLNQYDGYSFKIYKNIPHDPGSLSDNQVTAILSDRTGKLWIGTDGGGLNLFDRQRNRFSRFQNLPGDSGSLSHNSITSICENHAGTIWIGTYGGGLNKFDRRSRRFTRYRKSPDHLGSLSSDYVKSLLVDRGGVLWVATLGGGLNKLDRQGNHFTHVRHDPRNPHSLSSDKVQSVYEDRRGLLWIGTQDSGLNRFNPESETFKHYRADPLDPRSLSDNFVTSIIEDRSGILWIGTFGGGLNSFDRDNEKFTQYKYNAVNPGSLSHNYVKTIYEDRSGTLWIGTKGGGLSKMDPHRKPFRHLLSISQGVGHISQKAVWCFSEDQSGMLWVGTGAGLYQFDPEGDNFNQYALNRKIVSCIYEDGGGILWIGTYGSGLFKFDRREEKYNRYRPNANDPGSLSGSRVWAIHGDRTGGLWIGTDGGLDRFDPSRDQFIHYRHDPVDPLSLSHNFVRAIHEDRSGIIWIGTDGGGLDRFDQGRQMFVHHRYQPGNPESLSCNSVFVIHEDRGGMLWLGTGGGLNRFDRESGTFNYYLEMDGLADNFICGILEDEEGDLWISTFRGLSEFNPRAGKFRNFNAGDGLQSLEFNVGAYYKGRSGEMFFGGINGFNVFHPDDIKRNSYIPPVVLTALEKGNREIMPGQDVSEISELLLCYSDTAISLEFAALSFSNPYQNRYAYKLEGLSDDWIELGGNNRITFTNLDPGKYRLRVKGSNNDGVWNEEGILLKITVTPPFWKTWWFTLLSILLFSVLSYFVIHAMGRYLTYAAFWKKKNYFGRYKVIDKIASGGMGIIYKARDIFDKSEVLALKVMREEYFSDEIQKKRFLNEGAIYDQLHHPNIVRIVERGVHKGNLYIAMELLQGRTLLEFSGEEGRLNISIAVDIMVQIADALVFIHRKGIIHRDLKPENIMIVFSGDNSRQVKLLDFGLARSQAHTRLTKTGLILGTLFYLSPEQLLGTEISTGSDIYSLGVIFYEILAGRKPFPGHSEEGIITRILEAEAVELSRFRPDIPPWLNHLVKRMISKKPADRPPADVVLSTLREMITPS